MRSKLLCSTNKRRAFCLVKRDVKEIVFAKWLGKSYTLVSLIYIIYNIRVTNSGNFLSNFRDLPR